MRRNMVPDLEIVMSFLQGILANFAFLQARCDDTMSVYLESAVLRYMIR
jgi:hypothetical protein